MTTISVAMATYNGGRFIREQLDSIAAQTLLPTELVITDDGSDDNTIAIITEFSQTAPFPVRLHRNQQRLGYRTNFMKAACLCGAPLIAFCDQDDVWYPEKLETVSNIIMKDDDCLLLQHGFRLIDGSGRLISDTINNPDFQGGQPWSRALGLTQIFKKPLLAFSHLRKLSIDHNRPQEEMAHDQWIYFLAHMLKGNRIIMTPLLNYRQHDNNVCGFKTGGGEINNFEILYNLSKGNAESFGKKRSVLKESIEGVAAGAYGRVRVIEAMRLESTGIDQTCLGLRLAEYDQFHTYASSRAKIYAQTERRKRAWYFMMVLLNGFYFRNGIRGVKDSIIDLIYGVSRNE